jgi:hypothetical protein
MSEQLEREIKMYSGRVFGIEVSKYGIETGYLDYQTLSKIVGDCILNNNIMEFTGYENWDLVCGDDDEDNYFEIYQYYIITYDGFSFLESFTDELVYYHEELDMFLWGITHFGTGWDYVLTDIKLKEMN